MRALVLACIFMLNTSAFGQSNPAVVMETSAGSIKIELGVGLE